MRRSSSPRRPRSGTARCRSRAERSRTPRNGGRGPAPSRSGLLAAAAAVQHRAVRRHRAAPCAPARGRAPGRPRTAPSTDGRRPRRRCRRPRITRYHVASTPAICRPALRVARRSAASAVPTTVPRPPNRLVPPRTAAAMACNSKPSPSRAGTDESRAAHQDARNGGEQARQDEDRVADSRDVDARELSGIPLHPDGLDPAPERRASEQNLETDDHADRDDDRDRNA